MKPAPVIVTIDEVRLHGFDPALRSGVGEAIAAELTRLFSAPAAAQAPLHLARADGGTIAAGRDTTAGALGTSIAARVHATVRPEC